MAALKSRLERKLTSQEGASLTTSPPNKSRRPQSLGVLLLKVVFSIYLVVTMVITSAQMYEEYRFEKDRIEVNLATYQAIFGPAVATALWNLDQEQLLATLEGASQLQDIAGILLYDNNKRTIFHHGQAPKTSDEHASSKPEFSDLFYQSFNISYSDKQIGSLYIYSSSQIVFDEVKYNFLFILINALIKSFVLWFVFLWAFKRYLSNALDRFIGHMTNTDFDSLDEEVPLPQDERFLASTELQSLNTVFLSLKARLYQSKQVLENLNVDLEATIDKRTELLRRQQRVMEAMSQQARIGAWEYNLETETTYWSNMTRSIFEVDSSFVPDQQKTLGFFDPANAARLRELTSAAISMGQPWESELLATTTKGTQIHIASTGEPEFRNGQCIRIFGSFQDIDERIRTQEALIAAKNKAEEADRLKNEFLASMSHEIRTPMNGIIGMLNVLLNNDLNDSQTQQAMLSLRSAESLLSLLNDLLDVSRIESGNFDLNDGDFNLQELIRDQVALWEPKAQDKDIKLTLSTDKLETAVVNGDAPRIRQIVTNLLSNAIKFSNDGEIKVDICSTQGAVNQVDVLLSVADQGIGIESIAQQTIFDSFVQVDASSSRQQSGAGLGLSIVKEIALLMGGDIWVESKPGEGCTFFVRLKLKEASPASKPKLQLVENKQASSDQACSSKVLVVEDNPVNQLVAQALLEQLGLHVDLAGDGIEALERLNASIIDGLYTLIIMDCQMPNMDGYQATKAIRQGKAGEPNCRIPIIAMTANAMEGDKEKCLKAGMDDYISKPVTPEALSNILKRWTKR